MNFYRDYSTCHPRHIHREALKVVDFIVFGKDDLKNTLELAATSMYCSATRNLAYTRTVALIALDVIHELGWRGHSLSDAFRDELQDIAVSEFTNHWKIIFTKEHDELESDTDLESDKRSITAFIGDLFAMGLLRVDLAQECIRYLVNNCKFGDSLPLLYMLLSRATSHRAQELETKFLCDCTHILSAKFIELQDSIVNISEGFSLMELMGMLLMQKMGTFSPIPRFPLSQHIWDRNLSCQDLIDLSVSNPVTPKELD